MKKTVLAMLAVFALWFVLGYVLHGIILAPVYAGAVQVFRPMAEFKFVLNAIVGLVSAGCFVFVYAGLIADKSLRAALTYGAVWGLGGGISMGYGSYSAMPIPYYLALGWFLGTLVEGVIGAWVAWLITARGAAR